MFSGILLPVRERIRNEIGTEVSVNGGEGKFGCVMVLTGGVLTCAHNSVSAVREIHS